MGSSMRNFWVQYRHPIFTPRIEKNDSPTKTIDPRVMAIEKSNKEEFAQSNNSPKP